MTQSSFRSSEEFIADLTKRTLYTAAEAAIASAAAFFGGSGIGLNGLTNIAADEKVGLALGTTVIAAVAASLRTTWAEFRANKAQQTTLGQLAKGDLDEAVKDIESLFKGHGSSLPKALQVHDDEPAPAAEELAPPVAPEAQPFPTIDPATLPAPSTPVN